MSRARDIANIHDGSTDITTLGTVTTGTFNGTIGSSATFPLEHHYFHDSSDFVNSWLPWDWAGAITGEKGVRVRRMGPIYIVDVAIYKSSMSLGTFSEKVLELGSDITHPSNTVHLGIESLKNATNEEYSIMSYIDTGGHLYIQGSNDGNATMYLFNSFVGLDVA